MADDRIREQIVTTFFLKTCRSRRWTSDSDVYVLLYCTGMATKTDDYIDAGFDVIPLTTGSAAEFCIEPMLSCVGDVDTMYHRSNLLAVPAGYRPPAQLPAEFDSRAEVFEIVDSEFPGYVHLMTSCLLIEIDDDQYRAVQCERVMVTVNRSVPVASSSVHGPAYCYKRPFHTVTLTDEMLTESRRSVDTVFCVRCLIWPPQAADWPTRQRNGRWPDSATVARVIGNGCDVVGVAHRLCG